MKHFVIACMAALTMATTCCKAQDDNNQRRERKFDPQEMIQRRTNDAVKKYGLDEAQAKKLLELNQKYDTLLMRPMGGPRRGGRPEGGPRPDGFGPGPQMGGGERRDSMAARPELTEEQKANFEKERKKMDGQRQKVEEARKAYDAELQKLMTSEQYEKYKADSQKRGQRRGGRPNQ